MAKKQRKSNSKYPLGLSSQKVWENIEPIATIMTDMEGSNQPKENEDDEMKETKRIMMFVNVAAIVICTGVLINRASICLERYIFFEDTE